MFSYILRSNCTQKLNNLQLSSEWKIDFEHVEHVEHDIQNRAALFTKSKIIDQ